MHALDGLEHTVLALVALPPVLALLLHERLGGQLHELVDCLERQPERLLCRGVGLALLSRPALAVLHRLWPLLLLAQLGVEALLALLGLLRGCLELVELLLR
eukprot:2725495-Alexandrium_andersonii.AAC.1